MSASVRQSDPPLRLLSVPAGHPYVRHIQPERPGPVMVLDDAANPWWESPVFDPEWLAANTGCFDVAHVHFGFDAVAPQQLLRWCDVLEGAGAPLVVTVHDLRNPHHAERTAHDAQLGVLVARAATVLTLSAGAASEIARRWNRIAEVMPHPHLAPLDAVIVVERRAGLVGISLRTLRANVVEPERVIAIACAAARAAGGHVHVLCDEHDPPRRSWTALKGTLTVDARPRLSDVELASWVASLHAMVLPYRWGSHSGWVELCRDMATPVVAPDCGYYAQQWDGVVTYRSGERDGIDERSLSAALREVLAPPPGPPAAPGLHDWRRMQRHVIAERHHAIYHELCARGRERHADVA